MEEIARDGNLVLRRRDDGTLELRANGVFVMDTAETATERELAARALGLHPAPRRVLVGGLGLGFTLAAVLDDARVRRCDVIEIEPALVDWLRAGVVPHGSTLLADPRAVVTIGDVADALREAEPATYDVVLLDVDNGPGYLVHDSNRDLYEAAALDHARRATRPGGMVVVWSAAEAPELGEAMRAVFGQRRVEAISYAVDLQGRDEAYWLYVGHVAGG